MVNDRKPARRRSKSNDEGGGTPCAALTSVSIMAGYSESVEGESHRTYKASIMQTLTLDPNHPDFDEVSAKWKSVEFVNGVRLFLSGMLKDSIHEEMIEDGVRLPEDDDEPDDEPEDDEEEDGEDEEDDEEEEDDDEDDEDEDDEDEDDDDDEEEEDDEDDDR